MGIFMSTNPASSNVVNLETYTKDENLDELLTDEDFISDLINAINQNIVIEVEDSHSHDE